ncbi:sensor histidine kinase [Methylobacillus gramineus]|uniref:sensor histidine kinase n=1 Tax=Methylobacillus gramineus TaxID=755169 RepID=UPI001CFFA42C|nr:sensor histidine kinase [Methylobacillus gramineus]MCB5184225.1 sensor histidine kinase [Methylobacillus gramineus]
MSVANSLRQKLLRWLLIALSLLVAVGIVTDYFMALEPAREVYDQHLLKLAYNMERNLPADKSAWTGAYPAIERSLLKSELDSYDAAKAAIFDEAGHFIAGESGLPINPPAVDGKPVYYDAKFNGDPIRVVALRSQSLGAVLYLAETTYKRNRLVQKTLLHMIVPELIFAIFAIVVLWVGVGRGLQPLAQIRAQINARSETDLSPMDEGKAPEEIREIITALNSLLARLDQSLKLQNQFLANAAHQLRTPLAGLQMQLELSGEQSPQEREQSHQRMLTSTRRIVRLANQLLALARAEGEADVNKFTHINISDAIQDLAADWLTRAYAKNIDLGLNLENVQVEASRWQIQEMLANLVDNALRYTPVGGNITIRCYADTNQGVIEVEDNGPGIPQDQREQVFDRFYRLDEGPEGCGLGLAIVREIVRHHGGSIAINQPIDGVGTLVTIQLPLVADQGKLGRS